MIKTDGKPTIAWAEPPTPSPTPEESTPPTGPPHKRKRGRHAVADQHGAASIPGREYE